MEFEKAAMIRDQIDTIKITLEKQSIQPTKEVDQDIIGIDHNDYEAAVVIISVRNGKTNKKDEQRQTLQRRLQKCVQDVKYPLIPKIGRSRGLLN